MLRHLGCNDALESGNSAGTLRRKLDKAVPLALPAMPKSAQHSRPPRDTLSLDLPGLACADRTIKVPLDGRI